MNYNNPNWNLRAQIVKLYGNQANFSGVVKVNEPVVSRVINRRHELSKEEQSRWATILRCDREEIFK